MSALVWEHAPDGHGLAAFDPEKLYRYRLRRVWGDPENSCVFLMLNPSTADAFREDPTIRRCLGFAKAWGHGALSVVNLFAYRSTNPKALLSVADPIGPLNDEQIDDECLGAKRIVCAWGANKAARLRGPDLAIRLRRRYSLSLLRRTKSGAPEHPLYVPADTMPQAYQ